MLLSHSGMCVLFLYQFSMPIRSSPVSTPSAWCPVVWEKTRRCILSLAPPWCIQRRLSPSRDASLSSTTLTVSGPGFSLTFSVFRKRESCVVPHPYPACRLDQLVLLCSLYPSSCFVFSPHHPLSCFFTHRHFVLQCSCFPPHLIIFLSLLIRAFSSHHDRSPSSSFLLCPSEGALLTFNLSSFSFYSTFVLILNASPPLFHFFPTSLSQLLSGTLSSASLRSCRC